MRGDISNDVITLGTCFSMFAHILARFHFAVISGNLIAQSAGSHGGIRGKNSNFREVVASSPSFSHTPDPRQSAPENFLAG